MPSAVWGWRSPGRQIIVLHFMSCSWSLRANVRGLGAHVVPELGVLEPYSLGIETVSDPVETHTMSPYQIWLD